ncbi:MAG: beta-ketoacyl synthase N-terminal-like domain-containing protein [Acidimicrobiales bacterium]
MTDAVVVTGLGTVHPVGLGHEVLWAELCRSADAPVREHIDDFDPTPWFGRNEARRLDPYVLFGVAAAHLAVADAGDPDLDPLRTGVVMGNLYGAGTAIAQQQAVMEAEGRGAVSATLCSVSCEDAAASQISIRLGLRGPSRLLVMSCASGTAAVGEAAALIATGRCDAVVAGATLGPVPDVIKASYENVRVRSRSGWERPFDVRRDGFEFCEGAAVVLLERRSHAEARGPHPGRGRRLGDEQRRLPPVQALGRRSRVGHALGHRARRTHPGRDRPRQRPRHGHRHRRRGGGRSDPAGLRRPFPPGDVGQGGHRALAGGPPGRSRPPSWHSASSTPCSRRRPSSSSSIRRSGSTSSAARHVRGRQVRR